MLSQNYDGDAHETASEPAIEEANSAADGLGSRQEEEATVQAAADAEERSPEVEAYADNEGTEPGNDDAAGDINLTEPSSLETDTNDVYVGTESQRTIDQVEPVAVVHLIEKASALAVDASFESGDN